MLLTAASNIMNLTRYLKIGNLKFKILCPSGAWASLIDANYGPFLTRHSAGCDGQISISSLNRSSNLPRTLKVTRLGKAWQIARYDFRSASADGLKTTMLEVEKNKYAFDSWLRIFFTLCGIKNKAILIHGAGYRHKQSIYVFPGRSGRGKSTLIRLLGKQGALSDELVCVYSKGSSFFGASTPFWGELKKGTGDTHEGPLKKIFFLKHGRTLALERTGRAKAVKSILKTALFFSKDRAHLKALLALTHGLALKVPSAVLSFRKDSHKADILETITGQEE